MKDPNEDTSMRDVVAFSHIGDVPADAYIYAPEFEEEFDTNSQDSQD